MIRTVADFLEAFKAHHLSQMPSFGEIRNPGMFGAMYEGLTQDILSKALPEGNDLRVVTGKVRNSKGETSRQLDCMITLGEGEKLPFTEYYIYPADRVLMIVEVKKTLLGSELSDAMDLFQHFWAEISEPVRPQTKILHDAWQTVTGTKLPDHCEAGKLPLHLEMLYHTLLIEACMPLRVVLGYEGYKDEWTLREGFYDWMNRKAGDITESRYRLNLNTFPNLVICGQSCIAKLDGLPYSAPIRGDGFLCWLGSRGCNPMQSLLEMLWTRLAPLAGGGPEIFGDDLDDEGINPFIFAKASKGDLVGLPENLGWIYECIPLNRTQLAEGNKIRHWEPLELSDGETILMTILGNEGCLDLTDVPTRNFFDQRGVQPEPFCQKLVKARIATFDGRMLELLTEACTTVMLPDGRNLVADNKTGKLSRYAERELERLRAERED